MNRSVEEFHITYHEPSCSCVSDLQNQLDETEVRLRATEELLWLKQEAIDRLFERLDEMTHAALELRDRVKLMPQDLLYVREVLVETEWLEVFRWRAG